MIVRRARVLLALALLPLAGCSAATTSPSRPSASASGAQAASRPPAPRRAVEVSQQQAQPAPRPAPPVPAPAPSVGPAPREQAEEASPPARPPAPAPATPAPAPGAAAPGQPGQPRRQVVFNFDAADVEVVLQAAAEIVGFNYVLAPGARGRKVTVQTQARIGTDDVFNVLLTILDVNGLAAIRSGSVYRIIPKEGAPQSSVVTIVGRETDGFLATDQTVTQIVPLLHVSAADAVNLLRPFVPAQGTVSHHRDTNLLIITDVGANVRRLLEVVKLIDVPVALDELQIIPIKHGDAQELAQLLSQLFATGRFRPAAAPTPAPTPPRPAAPTPRAPAPAAPTAAPEAAPAERPPVIVAERRSNSLIVHARKQEMETIRGLIRQLDVDIYGGQRVFIYFAENTKARDLTATLDAIYGRGTGGIITGTQQFRGGPGYEVPTRGGPPLSTPPAPPRAPTTPATTPTRPPGVPGVPGEEAAPFGAEVKFIADEVTNAVIVVTFPRLWQDIEETIKKLDKMPRQVLIEVLAAEVTLTDDLRLGVEWAVRSGRFDVSSSPSGTLPGRPLTGLLPAATAAGGAVSAGLNFFTFATDRFLAALNALAAEDKVNVLSNPSIMTTENKKAVINVSTSVPILTSQQVPIGGTQVTDGTVTNPIIGTQTVEYRDAGIILSVTPRIGEQGTVGLDVKQEVNEVGAPVPPTQSPRFTKREAETSVVLMNNQTLVLGGLIQSKRTLTRTGIPYLSKIPILGYLFGATGESTEKTELLLLITPRVVGTAVEAARITEELGNVTPELKRSLEQSPRPPTPGPQAPPEPPPSPPQR